MSTLTALNEDVAWADAICTKCGAKKLAINIYIDSYLLFSYLYPRIEPVGTWVGTEETSEWKIIVTANAKENPYKENAKIATVVVPEGMEVPAGEYTGEWYVLSTSTTTCMFYSDKFYGETYSQNKTYVSGAFVPNEDGTCYATFKLRYDKGDGTYATKTHKFTISKQ